jgi:hypothetical protein
MPTKKRRGVISTGELSDGKYGMLPRVASKYSMFGPKNAKFAQQTVLNILSFLDNPDLLRIMPVSRLWTKFALHTDLWQEADTQKISSPPLKRQRRATAVKKTLLGATVTVK